MRIVKDQNQKSRGYAFIEFEHKEDFNMAYRKSDREHIDERVVYSDYERGRTDKTFRPRRLGGHYPKETRPFPNWLQKEINNFKENQPDQVEQIKQKVSEQFHIKSIEKENEKIKRNRSRSRSRSLSEEKRRKRKESQRKEKNLEGSENNKFENHAENNQKIKPKEEYDGSENYKYGNQENFNEKDDSEMKAYLKLNEEMIGKKNYKDYEDEYSDSTEKGKRSRKDKKTKKDKKSKKDKKERKEKKMNKREKRDSVEIGEII